MANAQLSAGLILAGVSGSLGLAIALPVHAQLQVTGGGATLENADIFVPTDGTVNQNPGVMATPNQATDERAIIYNSTLQEDSLMLQTDQGNIPSSNVIFRPTTLPTFNTDATGIAPNTDISAGGFVGAQGEMRGALFFRGLGDTGAPRFFNIPTTLNFEVSATGTLPMAGGDLTEYRAENFVLVETGLGINANSFGVVQRRTPVNLVQYATGDAAASQPSDQTILGNDVPADAYAFNREGETFSTTQLDLTFNDGTIFTPPGIGLEAIELETGTGTTGANFTVTTTVIEESFSVVRAATFTRAGGAPRGAGRGRSQARPLLPRQLVIIGLFTFRNVPSGQWCDPPAAEGFEYTMIPRDVAVGLSSRVFPGMTGLREASDAVFTAITGFPEGLDEDNRFTVSVAGVEIGEFGPGDDVVFSDYPEVLGELLVDGGVATFEVTDIDPAVDSSDPEAFPLRLEFNTPTASFEMRAMENTADGFDSPLAVMYGIGNEDLAGSNVN